MDENSSDRENRRSLATRPFASIDFSFHSLALLSSPLISVRLSFSALVSRAVCFLESLSASCATISSSNFASMEARSILDAWKLSLLSLSLSHSHLTLSQSAVDFLVHRPNFPGRYGQFNTGLPSTSPCQIGGRPLFQCLSWDKGQNRFLRAPQSAGPLRTLQ